MTITSLDTRMPVVTIAGDAQARGHQHGEALRDSIAACIAIYDNTFQLAEAEVVKRAAHFSEVTRRWHPRLADEIEATAIGAAQPAHWLWAINARSEIMSFVGASESECTSVWSSQTRTLAQNWDWMQSLEEYTVILDVTHEDDHHVVTVSEPGMVGKIGMSSAGTAVGLNFLFAPVPLDGVPIHVLLRALLDARNDDEVEATIATAGVGRSGHVFLGKSSGVGSSLEYSGTDLFRRDSDSGPLLHTNHFQYADEATDLPVGTDSSDARLERSEQLVAEHGVDTNESIQALLDDGENTELPICRPWAPSATLEGTLSGTVCAVMMRLADGEMDVRLGPDPSGTWQTCSV